MKKSGPTRDLITSQKGDEPEAEKLALNGPTIEH